MSVRIFELAGIPIPIDAGGAFARHAYRQAIRKTDLPMGDGSIRRQIYSGSVGKLIVELSAADMPAPAGLASLDPALTYTLRCGAARTISAISNSVALPAARRTDAGYEPRGWAIVGDQRVRTPCALVGNTATCDLVAGATGYAVDYWPEIIGLVDFEETADAGQARYGWTLTVTEA